MVVNGCWKQGDQWMGSVVFGNWSLGQWWLVIGSIEMISVMQLGFTLVVLSESVL